MPLGVASHINIAVADSRHVADRPGPIAHAGQFSTACTAFDGCRLKLHTQREYYRLGGPRDSASNSKPSALSMTCSAEPTTAPTTHHHGLCPLALSSLSSNGTGALPERSERAPLFITQTPSRDV